MSLQATLPAGATPAPAFDWTPFRFVVPGIALGLALLGLLFQDEVVAAVRTWNESTAYNHCILIIPIFCWLFWDRRFTLIGVPIRPQVPFALLALPCIAAWLVAERLGIMEGRQLMLLSLVQVLFLSVLGWRMYKALLGPMLYLFFLVPFGAFLTTPLQDFTTAFTLRGLDVLGIPYYSDGYMIQIAQGSFLVAEACAGLRFLIASVAFGALYALVMYRSPHKRLIFMLVSIVTPIIANGFRALGIVVLGRILGSAEAAGADHIIYGWVFFSFVILLLVLFGLPFREDLVARGPTPEPAPLAPDAGRLAIIAAAIVAVLAASGPAAVAGVEKLSAPLAPAGFTGLNPGDSCTLVTSGPGITQIAPAPAAVTQYFRCSGYTVTVRTQLFSPRAGAGRLLEAQRRALTILAPGEREISSFPVPDQRADIWQLTEIEDSADLALSSLWVDGNPTRIGLMTRIRLALRSVVGGGGTPVLVTITPTGNWRDATPGYRNQAKQALLAFFKGAPTLTEQIAKLSAAPDGKS